MKYLYRFGHVGMVVLLAMAMVPGAVVAAETLPAEPIEQVAAVVPSVVPAAASPSAPRGLFDDATSLAPEVLEAQRGGTDTVTNVMNLTNDIQSTGTVTGNQAYNLTTGTNSIADGAFVGANGLSLVVQNTGNNVLIQSSTIINLQLK